jgi:hypothetical protein
MICTDAWSSKPTSGLPLLLIGLVFVVSRLAVLPLPLPESDVGIYARYAWEQAAAERRGVPFYEFHAGEVERQEEDARAAGVLAASIDEYKDVEYPPLALAVMRLPTLWMGREAGESGMPRSFEMRYYLTFRASMVVIDGVLFLLLAALVRRLFSGEGKGERGQRLLLYTACTLVLWHLLYDRLDLLLTALTVLALALLIGRRHYGWSFAVLAGAILFKLVPVVLVPLWVVGSMPAGQPLKFSRPQVLARLGARVSLLLALVVVGFLPFYFRDGERCLGFLTYHRARPLEIGSLYSSLPLAVWPLGFPLRVSHSYGSVNLHSSLTPTLVALSPWVTAGVLLATTVLLLVDFRRLSALSANSALPSLLPEGRAAEGEGVTLAHLHPVPTLSYALLLLMLFIAANKVFSTQYLLWLAPLVALVPLGPRGRRLFTWTFLLVCVLSTILVPFLFVSDLIDPIKPPSQPPTLKTPTARLAILLVIRNLLFLALVAGLASHLLRRVLQKAKG